MKTLLTAAFAIEALAGVTLLIVPSPLVLVLLGSHLDELAGLVIARVLGAALLSLGAACWFARTDPHGRAAAGVIAAMLLYNIAVAAILGYARIGMRISGAGLLPALILHSSLAVWCVGCLQFRR